MCANIIKKKKFYLDVKYKFIIAFVSSLAWTGFAVFLAQNWINDLADVTNMYLSILIITGIAFLPGFINAFLLVSLLLDRQPNLKEDNPDVPVTILIAAYNEEKIIYNTLSYIAKHNYFGKIKTFVIDNNSSYNTKAEALRAKENFGLDLDVLIAKRQGKFHALNKGLKKVKSEFVITLDADTVLHKSAIRFLVARILSSPKDVAAVAGSVLCKNSRQNLLARVQEWDYFLSICSVKRMQGLYQGTLVAQGAFSIYKMKALREIGGWSDSIGEDIVLTWDLLQKKYCIYFETKAVSFTEVPTSFKIYIRQRSRWARGMIEGLRKVKPWEQPTFYSKFLTGIDFFIPYMDFSYTFFWIPELLLAFFGKFYIVGPMTSCFAANNIYFSFIILLSKKESFRSA